MRSMRSIRILFFGSFGQFSAHVLSILCDRFTVTGVVTVPPKPKGRHLTLSRSDVAVASKDRNIPVFELPSLDTIPQELPRPEFLVVAGYGKRIPAGWLSFPTVMPVNMHPSLLPHLRGAFPAEWAILRGDASTGVTLVKMSEAFDAGDILAQREYPIASDDTRESLYRALYDLGAQLLVGMLPKIAKGDISMKPQPSGDFVYARRLTREDGFVPWELIEAAIEGGDIPVVKRPAFFHSIIGHWPLIIERASRALFGWPGVWTDVNIKYQKLNIKDKKKRLKIIRTHVDDVKLVLDTVQLEGKKPVAYAEISSTIVT